MASPRDVGAATVLLPLALLLAGGCEGRPAPAVVDTAQVVPPEKVRVRAGPSGGAVYDFGFDLRASPERDARQYLPFLDYLERATGERFRLHFPARSGSVVDDLATGHVEFAAVGSAGYLLARQRAAVVPLARGVNAQGAAEYRAVVAVTPDSPIRRLAQLRGRRVALGSEASTQGHILPRAMLLERGIGLTDLARYEFTGSHQRCADALLSGRFDACGLQDVMGRRLEAKGQVRVIAESEPVPSSLIAAHPDVPEGVRAKVRAALLGFQPLGRDAAGLQDWDQTEMAGGFAPADDALYAGLRRAMTRLGMLGSTGAAR